jgi:hypothetical protein
VTSKASSDFWTCFDGLPKDVQKRARKQYRLFRQNPAHRSLQFKELTPGLMSIRVTLGYRALAWKEGDALLWFWIGSHAEYDRLISRA